MWRHADATPKGRRAPADLPALAALWADPQVVRHIGGRPFTPEAGWALAPALNGRGYAREALAAIHAWGDAHLGAAHPAPHRRWPDRRGLSISGAELRRWTRQCPPRP